MSRIGDIPGRLYRGEISLRIVHRQKMWYGISGLILLVSVVALLTRGLNFSVEFTGGSIFQFPAAAAAAAATQSRIASIVQSAGGGQAIVQHVHSGLQNQWHVQTGVLNDAQSGRVQAALEHAFHLTQNQLVVQVTGPSWGGSVTNKALEALIIFLVVIVIYLSIAFEWRMAISAFIALLHDILIAVGVYALIGFPVSPDTVIGFLTILGYSLYDTVVVFDKVRENTAALLTTQKSTYSDAANLALNQTLVRSINTSLTALLPVAAILFIGGGLLGAGTLNDLSLVLFVGMLSGTYSSLFIATPVLADLKEREPRYKELAAKVARRAAGGRAAQRAAGEAGSADAGSGTDAVPDPEGGLDDAQMTTVSGGPSEPAGRPVRDGTRPVSRQQPRRGGGTRKKRR
ncbi:MAG: protein translocase subunit SecF [Streptosporangiales bacterium]|nr:protein translocase subunit SecF [Streptosporangiales bacterium]